MVFDSAVPKRAALLFFGTLEGGLYDANGTREKEVSVVANVCSP